MTQVDATIEEKKKSRGTKAVISPKEKLFLEAKQVDMFNENYQHQLKNRLSGKIRQNFHDFALMLRSVNKDRFFDTKFYTTVYRYAFRLLNALCNFFMVQQEDPGVKQEMMILLEPVIEYIEPLIRDVEEQEAREAKVKEEFGSQSYLNLELAKELYKRPMTLEEMLDEINRDNLANGYPEIKSATTIWHALKRAGVIKEYRERIKSGLIGKKKVASTPEEVNQDQVPFQQEVVLDPLIEEVPVVEEPVDPVPKDEKKKQKEKEKEKEKKRRFGRGKK